ncbi:unnamed protein product [Menidia menidia]|uniref:(Atlantic silverside) hypothetical protein n=1 Tax=Menidia menidia TaxID=238744 RepID=A0A8S4BB40_9TELE|nr:unnamed protein product [Menidia menidia]
MQTRVGVLSCAMLLLLIQLCSPLDARRVRGGRAQPRRAHPQHEQEHRERAEGPESFPLDFTAVESNTDSFVAQIKDLAQSLYPCSARGLHADMRLTLLKNVSVTCNDGSPAGYYIRESRGSRRWLLFLEGEREARARERRAPEPLNERGWYCFDKQTCDSRYETMRSLMSSSGWPQTRKGTGILSPQPEENPHWWNANMVAGGAGVLLNVDRVAAHLEGRGLGGVRLAVDNVHLTGPLRGQWSYIQELGENLRATLRDAPAVFAPACLSHELLTRPYWLEVQVRGTSLPRALHCWDRSLQGVPGSLAPPGGCPARLVDACPWPHCNPSCPPARDRITGREMGPVQFLKHTGFDVQKVARQQGMDPRRLLGMLSNGG